MGTRWISIRSVAPPRAVTLNISLYLCHPSVTVAMCVGCSLVDDAGLEYFHCILTQISICWKIQTVHSFGLGVTICRFDQGNDKVAWFLQHQLKQNSSTMVILVWYLLYRGLSCLLSSLRFSVLFLEIRWVLFITSVLNILPSLAHFLCIRPAHKVQLDR